MDLLRVPVVWVASACHARPVLIHQIRVTEDFMRLPIVGQQCGKEALLDLHAAMLSARFSCCHPAISSCSAPSQPAHHLQYVLWCCTKACSMPDTRCQHCDQGI